MLTSWAVGLVLGGIAIGSGRRVWRRSWSRARSSGSGLGGVQVADRVLMVRLSPPDRIGEFFGIYGLVGKGSQVVGQLLYGATLFLLLDPLGNGAYQVAVLSLLVTMLIGLWLVLAGQRPLGRLGRGRRWARERAAERRRRAWRRSARRSTTAARPRQSPYPPGWPAATPRRSRSSPRASTVAASSRGRRRARSFAATSTGGSPARRGPHGVRDRPADDRLGGGDHLAHAEAVAVPRLQASAASVARVARRRRLERQRGGLGEVRRRGCSRGSACHRASDSRRRRRSAGGPPRGASSTFGIRWVSGSWTSPLRSARAGDVEVAERDAPQPVGRAVPAQPPPRASASSRRTG